MPCLTPDPRRDLRWALRHIHDTPQRCLHAWLEDCGSKYTAEYSCTIKVLKVHHRKMEPYKNTLLHCSLIVKQANTVIIQNRKIASVTMRSVWSEQVNTYVYCYRYRTSQVRWAIREKHITSLHLIIAWDPQRKCAGGQLRFSPSEELPRLN